MVSSTFKVKKPSVYPIPNVSFKVRALGEAMDCLSMHDLVFPVMINRSETYPWKPIHQALIEQLGKYRYNLKFNDDDLGVQFTCLSWDILAQKKPNKKGKSAKYLFEPGLAGPASFTLEFLSEQAFDPDMENRNNDHLFILIGPRLEHVKGPISDGPCPQNPHACFPWHMFAPYDWGTQGIDINCIEGECPSPESALTLGVRRTRSPSPTPLLRNTRQRQGSLSDSVSGATETSGISGMEVDGENHPIQDEDGIDFPDINELPRLDSVELENWQDRIRFCKMGNFRLEAPTVDAASTVFIHLLKSLITGLPAASGKRHIWIWGLWVLCKVPKVSQSVQNALQPFKESDEKHTATSTKDNNQERHQPGWV
ncbi:hypothetical protein F5887DRAFT_925579 [Amanita rubescens]|nr:hypothetical protein F5887DRAFT_926008 [Amanita rubescens]KAF8326133.1 hypothetical protein F5887DRAFT_925579 [Amanita rubescens]